MSRRVRLKILPRDRTKVERQLWENELMDAANAGELELVAVRPYLAGQFMLCVRRPPVQPVGRLA